MSPELDCDMIGEDILLGLKKFGLTQQNLPADLQKLPAARDIIKHAAEVAFNRC